MAHSGVKTYSSASLSRAAEVGATRISVGSVIAVHEGSQQVLRTVEREKSAAFTASHLAAMTVLAQVATALGEDRGASVTAGWRAALAQLPDYLASGQTSLRGFAKVCGLVTVDFGEAAEAFANANSPEELERLARARP